MKNIYEILKGYGLEIPADKKAEFETALKENYIPISEHNKVKSARDNYKSQLDDATQKLEGFKGVNVEELQGKISALTDDLASQKAAFDKQLADRDFDDMLNTAITGSKAKNVKAVRALLDLEAIKASKNQSADIEAALKKVKEENDTETRANLRVAQCYSLKFNYVGFEDYYVRAVYAAAGETVPDRQEQSEKLTGAYASKLLISRNQWNNNVNRSDKNTITYSDVVDKDGNTVQGFTINDSDDSPSAYDKANTAYDRLYIDYVAAFDVKGLTGPSIMTTYHPMIKVEKLVDGVVKSTTYQAIAELDNKGRIEMCTGINGLTKLNVTKGTTFRFTPVLTDGKASNPTETTNITVDGQSKAFTTQSFTVDLYAYLNGEE